MHTSTSQPRISRFANDAQKAGGDISDAFSSFSGGPKSELPLRYSQLKKSIVPTQRDQDRLVSSWKDVLGEVQACVANVRRLGGVIIPQVAYSDIENGTVSPEELEQIRTVGTVVVKGAVSKEQALGWKSLIQEYTTENRRIATGFPPENPQVWELYHTRSQVQARTNPAVLGTQRYLLSLWHASEDAEVALTTPVTYFDRLRIRYPGDVKFALGPHVDGGSVERWEDSVYRKCFSSLFKGNSLWKEHDPFDATHRLDATMDMYKGQGACNVFRPWQGWVSLSSTSAGEGTLRVFPNLKIASAYILLRPFFQPLKQLEEFGNGPDARQQYLAEDNWKLDLESTAFPGSVPGNGQELSDKTHPHLMLDETMTSIPHVEPGDQVYWHCDVVHAVESKHAGKGDSSVMYIPACPLTNKNAEYLASQREALIAGYPPYDFSGGRGEGEFKGRWTQDDIYPTPESRRAIGFERFVAKEGATPGERATVLKAEEWFIDPK